MLNGTKISDKRDIRASSRHHHISGDTCLELPGVYLGYFGDMAEALVVCHLYNSPEDGLPQSLT